MLHQCSLKLRDRIKETEKRTIRCVQDQTQQVAESPLDAAPNCAQWVFPPVTTFDSTTWDEKWLQLVQHYFSLLKWPDLEQPSAPVALVEIMLDLCISFQVRVPVNLQVTKLQGPGVPVVMPKTPAKYFLPTRKMALVLPPESLKQTSHTFLRTFDFLHIKIKISPVDRENLRSLSSIGYSNVLLSLRISPVLLSGLQARNLLMRIIIPGVRVLEYSYVIPVQQPRLLPAHFPPDF